MEIYRVPVLPRTRPGVVGQRRRPRPRRVFGQTLEPDQRDAPLEEFRNATSLGAGGGRGSVVQSFVEGRERSVDSGGERGRGARHAADSDVVVAEELIGPQGKLDQVGGPVLSGQGLATELQRHAVADSPGHELLEDREARGAVSLARDPGHAREARPDRARAAPRILRQGGHDAHLARPALGAPGRVDDPQLLLQERLEVRPHVLDRPVLVAWRAGDLDRDLIGELRARS